MARLVQKNIPVVLGSLVCDQVPGVLMVSCGLAITNTVQYQYHGFWISSWVPAMKQ